MRSAKRLRQRKPKESSAQVIASNDDLLSELLLRLPIKSLLKLKCVCKQWLSLITDPNFTHRKHLKSNAVSAISGILLEADRFRYEFVPLRPLKEREPLTFLTFLDRQRISIIGSCKGLLLCKSSIQYCDKCVSKYYIYNPTTRQFRALPHPCGKPAGVEFIGFGLAFNPPKSHGYKVVFIKRHMHSIYDHCQIVVYSSETGLWRVSGAPFPVPLHIKFDSAVYFNGAIHWVDTSSASLCFDLEKELAREFPLPPLASARGEDSVEYFGESGGHLHLIYNSRATKFPIYEMGRDSYRWYVKFRVYLKGVVPSGPYIHIEVLCVARGEKEGDGFLVMRVLGKVFRYNLETKTHQVICNTNDHRSKQCKVIRCNFSKQTCEVIGKTYADTRSIRWPYVHKYVASFSPV